VVSRLDTGSIQTTDEDKPMIASAAERTTATPINYRATLAACAPHLRLQLTAVHRARDRQQPDSPTRHDLDADAAELSALIAAAEAARSASKPPHEEPTL
jgi:hypothetical protein